MDKHIKELEELLGATQKVIKRQQKEIEALRNFIDNINREHLISWDEFVEGKRK